MKTATRFIRFYRQSINPPYSLKDFVPIIGTLALIAGTPFLALSLQSGGEKTPAQKSLPIQKTIEAKFVSNEFLVKLKREVRDDIRENPKPEDLGLQSLEKKNDNLDVTEFEEVVPGEPTPKEKTKDIYGWYKVVLPGEKKIVKAEIDKKTKEFAGVSQEARELIGIIEEYEEDPNVEEAEPNFVIKINAVPNDPYYQTTGSWKQSYPDLWGIKKINPEPAWDQTTGSTSIVVADIDTGVDRNHEDIKNNMWVNTKEIPNNGMDDDKNGYKDDYYGWDFYNWDKDPMDDNGHGTHTVGTIAGVGNNAKGVVGVNWRTKVIALKFLSAGGYGYLDGAVAALKYAADKGARISSNSWGCDCYTKALEDALKYAHDKGMVIVAAAGNDAGNAMDFHPASSDKVITVGASDYSDNLAWFSNFGQKIDVVAPGVDILSAKAASNNMCGSGNTVGIRYCRVSGTSMAAPHVAGLAALLLAKTPSLTNEQIRQIIRLGADNLGANGKDKDFGYGRINVTNSMSLVNANPLAPIITSPISKTKVFGSALKIYGSVPGSNFSSYKIEVGNGREPTSWTTVATSNTQIINNGLLATVNTLDLKEGKSIFRLTTTDTSDKTYQFQIHDIEIDNFDTAITMPTLLVHDGQVKIIGTATTKNGLGFSNYKLEWAVGLTNWKTQGMSRANNGSNPVTNGLLGTWDTTSLSDSPYYNLRLTVNSAVGTSSQTMITVKIDKDLKEGWSKPVLQGFDCWSKTVWSGCVFVPTVADLDGDGRKEIIVTGILNKVFVFKADGGLFPGFPRTIGSSGEILWPANVVDLDKDGKKEIIVTVTYDIITTRIFILKYNGSSYSGWPAPKVEGFFASDFTPSVADLNGDGKYELIVVDPQYHGIGGVYAYQLNGKQLTGFPKIFEADLSLGCCTTASPTVADLDKDGKPEIIWGLNNKMYAFDNKGNLLKGWPKKSSYKNKEVYFTSTPSVGDIDGDGRLEITALAISEYCLPHECHNAVFAWEKSGTLISGWPKFAGEGMNRWCAPSCTYPYDSPSLADIDNDKKDEVVVAARIFKVMEMGDTKNFPEILSWTFPSLADVDGDGKFEFSRVFYARRQIGIIDDNYQTYWERDFLGLAGTVFPSNPALLVDLESDGIMELITIVDVTDDPVDLVPDTGINTVMVIWEIPKPQGATPKHEWLMPGHDPSKTGNLKLGVARAKSPTSTGTPIPSRKLADLNSDGRINIRDLSILLSRWGTTNRTADLNGDGRVNIRDLSILLSRWGR